MRVLAAMSGGVDSAVAAARAVEAGHEVVGVHLALSRMPGTLRTGSRGCCTIEDSMDAQRAANVIGIPYYVWDFSERFKLDVVDDFVAEYQAGRTPNPCMRCNERIKFAALLEKALALGFDAVCTGHYADIRTDANGNRELHRAAAWAKDQSYVLGVLTKQQLAHAMFPLGATPSKDEVRAEAAARGLSVAQKPDSHDICFIPDGDTKGWLYDRLGAEQGEIVERDGTIVGTHEGSHAYTIGQRRGLGIRLPAADGRPRFVLEIHPKQNRVVVGPREALEIAELAGSRFTWAGEPPVNAEAGFACEVQIRAHSDPVPATAFVRLADGTTPAPGGELGGDAVLANGSPVADGGPLAGSASPNGGTPRGVARAVATAVARGNASAGDGPLGDNGTLGDDSALGDDGTLGDDSALGGDAALADGSPVVDGGAFSDGNASELVIRPDTPIDGVAPGQTAVVYLGTRVLGQCTIDRTRSAVPTP